MKKYRFESQEKENNRTLPSMSFDTLQELLGEEYANPFDFSMIYTVFKSKFTFTQEENHTLVDCLSNICNPGYILACGIITPKLEDSMIEEHDKACSESLPSIQSRLSRDGIA